MRLKFNNYCERIGEVFDEKKFMNFTKLCVDTAKRSVKEYSLEDANAKSEALGKEVLSMIEEMLG